MARWLKKIEEIWPEKWQNILYPYCQTYCIRTAKHSSLKCDLIFHAECLFWWAWFCSVHFLWATAPEPIFYIPCHRVLSTFFAMRQWRGGTKRDASAQVYKCVNYMFNIVGKLVMERRRRTEEEGRKEGKFARRWRERTWKELVSICVMHFCFSLLLRYTWLNYSVKNVFSRRDSAHLFYSMNRNHRWVPLLKNK